MHTKHAPSRASPFIASSTSNFFRRPPRARSPSSLESLVAGHTESRSRIQTQTRAQTEHSNEDRPTEPQRDPNGQSTTPCRLRLHPRLPHRPTRAMDITRAQTLPVRSWVLAPAHLNINSRRRPRQGRAAAVALTTGSTRRRPRPPSRPPRRDLVSTAAAVAAAATRQAIATVTPVTAHTAAGRPRPCRAMRDTTAPPRPATSPAA